MDNPDFEELHMEFLALESELDLLNEQIAGVYFWERLRFSVHKRIAGELGLVQGTSSGSTPYSEYLKGCWLLARNVFVRNPYFDSSSELLFYGKGRRKQPDDDQWWDIYIDPLLDDINWPATFLERPYDVSHRRPAKTTDLRYTDLIQYTGTLLETFGFSSVSLSDDEVAVLDRIESEIRTRFGVDVSLCADVRQDLSRRRIRLPLYRRLVRRLNPTVAVLTAAYNGRETFVEACQAEGIPVVELQHGVITKYHMAYSFPDTEKHVFPNYFFTFGEYWSDAVDLPLPNNRVVPVGFPYLEQRAARYDHRGSEDRFVVISQPRCREQLSQFALHVSESEEVDSEVVYKLHPKEYDEWETIYPRLADSSVTVISREPPLYDLFATSTVQIGVNSTALFEGLQFDLSTYVLQEPGSEYMEYLVENGLALPVHSTEEFIANHSEQVTSFETVDRDYFFEPDALVNFEKAVSDLVGSQR